MLSWIPGMSSTPRLTDTEIVELRTYLSLFKTNELKEKFTVTGRKKQDVISAILANTSMTNKAIAMQVIYKDQQFAEPILSTMKIKELELTFGVKNSKKSDMIVRILSNADNRSKLESLVPPDPRPPSSDTSVCLSESVIIQVDDPLKSAVASIKKFYKIPKPDRRSVPTALREKVWRKHNTFKVDGKYRCSMDGNCFCCNSAITYSNHQSGHIVSDRHGGSTSVDNLRPVCASCNKNMGSANMYEYMFRQGWTKSLGDTEIIYLKFYDQLEQEIIKRADGDPNILKYLNYKKTPLELRMKLVSALLLYR